MAIPLKKKRNKPGLKFGCGCCFLGSVLFFAALPVFFDFWGVPPTLMQLEKFKAATASNRLATFAKECAVKKAQGELDPKFIKVDDYTFLPVDTDCDGDENNLITAQSKNTEKFPTYSYNVETGVKSCSHD